MYRLIKSQFYTLYQNLKIQDLKEKLSIIEQMVDELEDDLKYLEIKEMKQFHDEYLLLLKKGLALLEKEVVNYKIDECNLKKIFYLINNIKENYLEGAKL